MLPPSWDVQRQQWFHNMEIVRPDEHDETLVQQWNKNCVGCHVSQQENNYRPATRTYATQVDRLRHVVRALPRARAARTCASTPTRSRAPRSPISSIVRPTRLDPKSSSMICAQCHSLRDVIAPGYIAGADYYDHFLPLLENRPQKADDPAYWADGRPRRFSNDAIGLWQSQCFLQGGATCTNCHRDAPARRRQEPAAGAGEQRALHACHEEIGAAVTEHTRHARAAAPAAPASSATCRKR